MSTLVSTTMTAVHRRVLLFLAYLGLAALSNVAAFLLRFDHVVPAAQWELCLTLLPLLLAIRAELARWNRTSAILIARLPIPLHSIVMAI